MLKGLKIKRLPDGRFRVTPQHFTKGGGTYTAWAKSVVCEWIQVAVEEVMRAQETQLPLAGLE